MNKLIIGSTAIKHYFTDFPRNPKDLDYVVENKAKFKRQEGIEYLENPVILKYQKEGYLSPELMTSLKVSHLLWDVNWEKHMFDLQFLLKKGYKWDLDLVRELRVYWNETLPKVRRSKLEQSKEDFFTNAVNMDTHEHDNLHLILNPVPMYTRILKEQCEVQLDENKWEQLSFDDKCLVIWEETVVMQIERYKGMNPTSSYIKQLKSCIQKHFPIYISFFGIENYPILESYKRKEMIEYFVRLTKA